jgi:hypothetical protein
MEAARFTAMVVTVYHTTRKHIPKILIFNLRIYIQDFVILQKEFELLFVVSFHLARNIPECGIKLNSVALVRKRTIPTERRPLVGEVSANFCG